MPQQYIILLHVQIGITDVESRLIHVNYIELQALIISRQSTEKEQIKVTN